MIASGKAVAAAWVSARAAIGGTVAKDAKANYGKYATLAAVMDAITPANVLSIETKPLRCWSIQRPDHSLIGRL